MYRFKLVLYFFLLALGLLLILSSGIYLLVEIIDLGFSPTEFIILSSMLLVLRAGGYLFLGGYLSHRYYNKLVLLL